jgi:diguanylate cyclase (GGDEF)-like protein/PAS domain S-box-containing protein
MRPVVQIALALVLITSLMLLAVDFLFGVFPDPDAQEMRLRTTYAESLASQAAALLQRGDTRLLALTLDRGRKDDKRIRSIAVRTAQGTILAQSGEHEEVWDEAKGEVSTLTQLYVPLSMGQDRWGSVEIAYRPDRRNWVMRALAHPRMITIGALALLGMLVYWLYLRRALVHLDPSAVIPDRVRLAFDIMTDGVVVLDRRGRVLLANRAFRTLSGSEASELVGKRLSEVAWLASGLPANAGKHPWMRALETGAPVMDYAVEGSPSQGTRKKLVMSCAPIGDQGGTVRGCIATFNDLTALHLANERLSEALAELHSSRDEIQQKSIELEHMARHDTLTGCLNRRAFFERMSLAWQDARVNDLHLSCLALDVDQFKSVNDRFGHPAGDRVIKQVGDTLLRTLRSTDIVGRYGGDEFLVVMPGCDVDTACALAEKLRRTVEERCSVSASGAESLRVTVSIGVAALRAEHAAVSDLVEEADQALYAAKGAGRNRVGTAPTGATEAASEDVAPVAGRAVGQPG